MRGAKRSMDIITRAEFDDSMDKRLTENRGEVVSAVKEAMREKLEDLKVDLLDGIETKVSQARFVLGMESVQLKHLKDAKVEILATTRRNINDAVAPLATKVELDARFSKIDASHEAINKSIKDLTHFVMQGMGAHENRLKDQEASS
jgi:hypothetical protein